MTSRVRIILGILPRSRLHDLTPVAHRHQHRLIHLVWPDMTSALLALLTSREQLSIGTKMADEAFPSARLMWRTVLVPWPVRDPLCHYVLVPRQPFDDELLLLVPVAHHLDSSTALALVILTPTAFDNADRLPGEDERREAALLFRVRPHDLYREGEPWPHFMQTRFPLRSRSHICWQISLGSSGIAPPT
jgi:hypothetical protein